MIMLLPSFNFIERKERMKLLRNFHLTKVNQKIFLTFASGGFYGLKSKKIYNKRNTVVII